MIVTSKMSPQFDEKGQQPEAEKAASEIADEAKSAHTSDVLKPISAPDNSSLETTSPAAVALAIKPISPKAAARRTLWGDVAIRVGFVIFLIAFWHLAHYVLVTKTDKWSGALFPSPSEVALWLWDGFGLSYFTPEHYIPVPGAPKPQTFWQALMQKDYLQAIGASIYRLVWGYTIAVVIGFPLGLLVARFSLMEKTVGWLSLSLQSLPSICWIPLALLWFGREGNLGPILFVTIMGALFATVVAVADGIRNVPPLLARAGRTLGAEGARLYFSVLLPAALPGVVTGLKIGWSFAWRSLMAAELVVNEGGLGFLLQRDRDFGDAEGVLATILVIIVIGLSIQSLVFGPLERRLQGLWGLSGVRS
jgi:NitT/TauT family transport system permease protein